MKNACIQKVHIEFQCNTCDPESDCDYFEEDKEFVGYCIHAGSSSLCYNDKARENAPWTDE